MTRYQREIAEILEHLQIPYERPLLRMWRVCIKGEWRAMKTHEIRLYLQGWADGAAWISRSC